MDSVKVVIIIAITSVVGGIAVASFYVRALDLGSQDSLIEQLPDIVKNFTDLSDRIPAYELPIEKPVTEILPDLNDIYSELQIGQTLKSEPAYPGLVEGATRKYYVKDSDLALMVYLYRFTSSDYAENYYSQFNFTDAPDRSYFSRMSYDVSEVESINADQCNASKGRVYHADVYNATGIRMSVLCLSKNFYFQVGPWGTSNVDPEDHVIELAKIIAKKIISTTYDK